MKKIFTCFFALFVINNAYSLGIGDMDTSKIYDNIYGSDSVKALEGYLDGYKLFIDVISEMQMDNDRNFDIEHILNTYVSDVGPKNKTNYDWITYLTGDIAAVKMKMTVFMTLLGMYIDKQKEMVFFNKNFYKGIILSLDEYKNKGYKIKEEEIEELYIHGYRIGFWGKEYTVTTNNYTIYFYYDRTSSRYDSDPLKKIIIEKKSGATYFDHFIGSTKEAILSLRGEDNNSDDDDVLKYYGNRDYVLFYFENNIVKRIEYGDILR